MIQSGNKYKINIKGSEACLKNGRKMLMMFIYFHDTWDMHFYSYIAVIVH